MMIKKVPTEALGLAGLALLAAAAFMVAVPLGLAASGVALLLAEWRLEP